MSGYDSLDEMFEVEDVEVMFSSSFTLYAYISLFQVEQCQHVILQTNMITHGFWNLDGIPQLQSKSHLSHFLLFSLFLLQLNAESLLKKGIEVNKPLPFVQSA